jgi:hypothetical protein
MLAGTRQAQTGRSRRLKVDTNTGTVVLVTSGNTSFSDDAARRELLALLKTFETRLRKMARPIAR